MRFHGWLWLSLIVASPAIALEPPNEGETIAVIPGAGSTLDLDHCIQLTLTSNLQLQAERERLGELAGQVTLARSEALPSFDLNANWTRGRDPSFAFDESFGGSGDGGFGAIFDSLGVDFGDQEFSFIPSPEDIPAQTFWRTTLDGNWELRPTRLRSALRAANTAVDQQSLRVTDAEHRAIEGMLVNYHDVVLAHQEVAAVQAELSARDEFLQITRRRQQLDLATPLDTLQAAVSRANLMPQLRRAERRLRTTGEALNISLGRDPLESLALVVRFPLESDSVPEGHAIQLALQRPGLQSSAMVTKLLQEQRSAHKAQSHPFLSLNGSYGYVGRDTGTLFDTGHDTWRASVTLTVPLWDGQVTRGRVKETEAAIRRTEFEQLAARRMAKAEVLAALGELEAARANLVAADLNMQMAEDAYRQMSLRYELGRADNLQVLNAQSERFAARGNLIRARFDVLSTTATLKRAMGVSPAMPLSTALTRAASEETQ